MSNFQLPKFEGIKRLSAPKVRFWKNQTFWIIVLCIFLSSFFGFLAGTISGTSFSSKVRDSLEKLNIKMPENQNFPSPAAEEELSQYLPQTTEEKTVIEVAKEALPSVVSVIITKEVDYWDTFFPFGPPSGTKKQEAGRGTGFIVSEEGLIVTNKHVASVSGGDYTVVDSKGKRYQATILALDPGQDLAVLKIQANGLPFLKFGDSDGLEIGQTVIAIGNALGEFGNTVSVGVVSGLSRTITAGGGGIATEVLTGLIQTDAAINQGNSGGPLLNLRGEVVGVNTAMALGAENIGFAIPANLAKRDVAQVKSSGKITHPFLGVRYVLITDEIKANNNLPVNYGAWIVRGENPGEVAVGPGSAAQIAGIKEGDIILEFNGEKINPDNSLGKIIMKYNPGDKVTLKVLRGGQEKTFPLTLDERSS